jgi:acid stress chaperone HdeB
MRVTVPRRLSFTGRVQLTAYSLALALLALPSAEAQVTVDISKITCNQFLFGKATDSRTLTIWLNGYHSGASGKTLIDPNAMGERALIEYCIANSEMSVLNAARNVLGVAGNGR